MEQPVLGIIPNKGEIYIPCSSIAILDIYPREICTYVLSGNMYKNVHMRNICICQKLEIIIIKVEIYRIVNEILKSKEILKYWKAKEYYYKSQGVLTSKNKERSWAEGGSI